MKMAYQCLKKCLFVKTKYRDKVFFPVKSFSLALYPIGAFCWYDDHINSYSIPIRYCQLTVDIATNDLLIGRW